VQRRSIKHTAPLEERLIQEAERLRQEAKGTPPGIERERMIRRASPFPAPSAERTRFTEVWLVDDSGRFQLHTLTEGQRDH